MIHVGRARILVAALLVVILAQGALGAPPLPADEVRARRWIREEEPLWRRALALPAEVLLVATLPIKHALMWGERAKLHNRIADVMRLPGRAFRSQDAER